MAKRKLLLGSDIEMYRQMLRIRMVEERLIRICESDSTVSLMHFSLGQEAIAVGVCQALDEKDSVVSTHRCHAHYLAKGGDLKKMMAELFGKRDGCCGGRGGSMYLFDPDVGMTFSSALVGGSIPIAVGIALAAKLQKQNIISVAFFGDGAVEEGVFWESLNFSSTHKLSMLFVCENNLYAAHSRISDRQPSCNIFKRIRPHGVWSMAVDGNDALAVFSMAQKAIGEIKQNNRPAFIEARTYRLREHWGPGEDWDLGYRSKKEGDHWLAKCPLKRLERFIRDHGHRFDDDLFSGLRLKINQEIEIALKFAEESLEPLAAEFLREEVGNAKIVSN